MKQLIKLILASTPFLFTHSAQATVVNFINLTEAVGGYGESGWSPLTITGGGTTVWISGHANNDDDADQYAYLDWGNAGLGSCKDLTNSVHVNMAHPSSGTNYCKPDSDDNVTEEEYVRFVFDQDVVVKNVWFNNNHDGGLGMDDKALIQGSPYSIMTGYAGGVNGVGSFTVNAGDAFDVGFYNEQFYISGIEFVKVAEPSSTLLFGIGLLSLIGIRRMKF